MKKSRVGVRLKDAVGGGKSHNRSADLQQLTNNFYLLKKKISALTTALRNHHASMSQLSKTRLQVAEVIGALTTNTPLFNAAGKLPSPEGPRDTICSFSSVHHALSPKSQGYNDKYSQFVINYVVEWDRIITTRVEKGLKNAEDLRRDYDHYQKKAESLRASANATLTKGKTVDSKSQEKLARNEEKLVSAKALYDKFATEMCIYIEELTERSWKDLHPCLVKMAQFEMTISKEEAACFTQMDQVVKQLKTLGDQHKLEAAGRLKELETQQPSILSTREATSPSAITNGSFNQGPAPMGVGGDPWSQQQYLPPGSVAPQGMGGFPVAIASARPTMSREPSTQSLSVGGSAHGSLGPMSTSDMIAIANSAAPPPTMDDLNFATQRSLTISTTPSHSFGYGNQFGDDVSAASSITMPLAPPPMGAPPPLPPSGYTSPMANPYAFAPPAPMPAYGAPSYVAQAPASYGAPVYGAPAPYGAPAYGAPAPASYGAPLQYGAPPNLSYGAPPPLSYGAPPPINPYGGPPAF